MKTDQRTGLTPEQVSEVQSRTGYQAVTNDLGDTPAAIGDACVLWGEGLPADEVAAMAGTISYELFCKVTPRVQRFLI